MYTPRTTITYWLSETWTFKLIWNAWHFSVKLMTETVYREKPSCIDLLLTNQPQFLQSSSVASTGLLGFNDKITVTAMKTTFEKLKPKVTYFTKWKGFCNEKFRMQLLSKLSLANLNKRVMELTYSWKYALILLTYFHTAGICWEKNIPLMR